MKIFAVSTLTVQHGLTGGMERYFDLLVRGLAEMGHDVNVITTELQCPGKVDGITMVALPVTRGERGKRWDRELARFCIDTTDKPDVFLSNSFVSHSLIPLSPRVATIVQGTGLVDLIGTFRLLASGRPSLVSCAKEIRNVWRDSYRNQKKLMKGSARVLAVSKETGLSVSRLYGIAADKIEIIPSPVDTSVFYPEPDRSITAVTPASPLRIVSAGTLSRQKGFDVLLRALAILLESRPDCFRLAIAGHGPEMPQLQQLSARLGISGPVNFLGSLKIAEIAQLFRENDLFVLSTFREEGFPLVISEALASGLPVIASRVGGNPTAVREGTDGYLVKAGSSRELAARIKALADQPELRLRMATAARARAVAELDKSVISRRVDKILNAVIRDS